MKPLLPKQPKAHLPVPFLRPQNILLAFAVAVAAAVEAADVEVATERTALVTLHSGLLRSYSQAALLNSALTA